MVDHAVWLDQQRRNGSHRINKMLSQTVQHARVSQYDVRVQYKDVRLASSPDQPLIYCDGETSISVIFNDL
jgi:hypothetical protein